MAGKSTFKIRYENTEVDNHPLVLEAFSQLEDPPPCGKVSSEVALHLEKSLLGGDVALGSLFNNKQLCCLLHIVFYYTLVCIYIIYSTSSTVPSEAWCSRVAIFIKS